MWGGLASDNNDNNSIVRRTLLKMAQKLFEAGKKFKIKVFLKLLKAEY
jgi:hypothetical protein